MDTEREAVTERLAQTREGDIVKEIDAVVIAAENQGWKTKDTGAGGRQLFSPDGKSIVTVPHTVGGRSFDNMCAQLRRAGVVLGNAPESIVRKQDRRKRGEVSGALRRLMRSATRPMSPSDMASAIGVPGVEGSYISNLLSKWRDAGDVVKQYDGWVWCGPPLEKFETLGAVPLAVREIPKEGQPATVEDKIGRLRQLKEITIEAVTEMDTIVEELLSRLETARKSLG